MVYYGMVTVPAMVVMGYGYYTTRCNRTGVENGWGSCGK
jgi:hypothetical protein